MRVSLLAAIACVVLMGGSAIADTRLRVAVLGLEVTGTVDEAMTVVARELTDGMRGRARIGNGPYRYAPSSERELIDEKLIKQCDSEAPACMALIARDVGADILVYGKVDKESGGGYRVKLFLLDAGAPAKINNLDVLAAGMVSSEDARTLARQWYDDLVGTNGAGGTLEISANVDVGTVLVDDVLAERLADGKASITLAEGHHVIAIEAPGKARKEAKVTIKRGAKLTQNFDLVAAGIPRERIDIWKPTFIISGSLTAVLGVYGVYLYASWKGNVGDLRAAKPDDPMTPENEAMEPINEDDCDGPNASPAVTVDEGGVLADVCRTRDKAGTVMWLTAGVGVVAVLSGVMWYRNREKKKRERGIALIPVLTPETAGATLELRW